MNDPTIACGGLYAFSAVLETVGERFLRGLAKQKPFVSRDERLLAEWLAYGKQAIGFGVGGVARDMQRAGAPIFQPDIEMNVFTQGNSALVLLKK